MRLQHSRSSALIAIAGRAHAMIGAANSSSDNSETPTLPTSFITSRKYRFNRRLDAIQLGKLQVTDGRNGSTPSLLSSLPTEVSLQPSHAFLLPQNQWLRTSFRAQPLAALVRPV